MTSGEVNIITPLPFPFLVGDLLLDLKEGASATTMAKAPTC